MNIDYLTIIGVITGGGATGFLVAIATMKSQYFQQKGIAKQEIAKGDQEEVTTLSNLNDLMVKLTTQTNEKFDEMSKEMEEVKTKLNKYIVQCNACPNNHIR